MQIKTYKRFQFKYVRGNAERESSYDIFHERQRVASGENLKDCRRIADDLLTKPNNLQLRKFLFGERLPTKRPLDRAKRAVKKSSSTKPRKSTRRGK